MTITGRVDEKPGSKKCSFPGGWVQADIQTHANWTSIHTEFITSSRPTNPTPTPPVLPTPTTHSPVTIHHNYHHHWHHYTCPYRMAISAAQHYRSDHHWQLYADIKPTQQLILFIIHMYHCIHECFNNFIHGPLCTFVCILKPIIIMMLTLCVLAALPCRDDKFVIITSPGL